MSIGVSCMILLLYTTVSRVKEVIIKQLWYEIL